MARKSPKKTAARKSPRTASRARGSAKRTRRTAKRPSKPGLSFHEGPAEWLGPMLEEAYTRLRPKEEGAAPEVAAAAGATASAAASAVLASAHEAVEAEEAEGVLLADLPQSYWEDLLREYKQ